MKSKYLHIALWQNFYQAWERYMAHFSK